MEALFVRHPITERCGLAITFRHLATRDIKKAFSMPLEWFSNTVHYIIKVTMASINDQYSGETIKLPRICEQSNSFLHKMEL